MNRLKLSLLVIMCLGVISVSMYLYSLKTTPDLIDTSEYTKEELLDMGIVLRDYGIRVEELHSGIFSCHAVGSESSVFRYKNLPILSISEPDIYISTEIISKVNIYLESEVVVVGVDFEELGNVAPSYVNIIEGFVPSNGKEVLLSEKASNYIGVGLEEVIEFNSVDYKVVGIFNYLEDGHEADLICTRAEMRQNLIRAGYKEEDIGGYWLVKSDKNREELDADLNAI